jgi:hypothetical protein
MNLFRRSLDEQHHEWPDRMGADRRRVQTLGHLARSGPIKFLEDSMSSRKTVLGVLGSLFAIAAIGLLIAGTVVIWTTGRHRNAEGFITTSTSDVSTDSYALTSTQLDLSAIRNDWLPASWLATIQVTASPRGDAPMFVGIGPADDVAVYLDEVAHDEFTRIADGDVTYLRHAGDAPPAIPSEQGFWVADAEGNGSQSLTWDIEPGQWTVLIMNANATPDVAVGFSTGARTPWLLVGIAILLGGGLFCAAVSAVMLFFAFKRPAIVIPGGAERVAPPLATVPTGSKHDPD